MSKFQRGGVVRGDDDRVPVLLHPGEPILVRHAVKEFIGQPDAPGPMAPLPDSAYPPDAKPIPPIEDDPDEDKR